MEKSVPDPYPRLNRAKVMRALSVSLRRDILEQLAQRKRLSVGQIAAQTDRNPDLISKHLRVLREAGAVVVEPDAGNDARRQLYAVPAQYVPKPGVIDFGFCVLRFE